MNVFHTFRVGIVFFLTFNYTVLSCVTHTVKLLRKCYILKQVLSFEFPKVRQA